MGCDIHLYFEKKVRGKWVPFTDIPESEYPDGRSYDVFALLAGVRGYYPKNYFGGRGLPEDTSLVGAGTDDCSPWIGDHSFTYATIFELKKVKWEKYMEYEPHFARFIKQYFPLDTANDKNIRILMGFDS